ncbi:MAG: type 1 glutamine amidotransferase [Pseudomonadota bacterium]
MHLLVLQHETVEHPGIFRSFLAEDGHTYDAIEMQKAEALPPIDDYDALWVMGGPQDTWQEDEFPWLKNEKLFIREAVVDRQLPFFGLCLGHQLLAEALGGKVGPSETPEVGVMDVELNDHPATKRFFAGLPQRLETLQWHGAEVTDLPNGIDVLAASPACRIQAIAYGNHAVSAQFHFETEPDTVENWSKIPAYAAALERALGAGALPKLDAEVSAKMGDFNAAARQFYTNWMKAAVRHEPA